MMGKLSKIDKNANEWLMMGELSLLRVCFFCETINWDHSFECNHKIAIHWDQLGLNAITNSQYTEIIQIWMQSRIHNKLRSIRFECNHKISKSRPLKVELWLTNMCAYQICSHHLRSFRVPINDRPTAPLPATCPHTSNQAASLFREGANM